MAYVVPPFQELCAVIVAISVLPASYVWAIFGGGRMFSWRSLVLVFYDKTNGYDITMQ